MFPREAAGTPRGAVWQGGGKIFTHPRRLDGLGRKNPFAAEIQLQTARPAVVEIGQADHLNQLIQSSPAQDPQVQTRLTYKSLEEQARLGRQLRQPGMGRDGGQGSVIIE